VKTSDLLELIECLADAVLIVAPDGRITAANTPAQRLFGYLPEEFPGMSVEDLIPSRFRRGHEARRSEFGARPGARPMGGGLDLYALTRDGREIEVDVSLSRLEGGAVLAAVYDISRRKRAEESLVAAREFSDSIVATIQEALLVLDAELRVIAANPAFLRSFRASPEQVVGQPLFRMQGGRWDLPPLRALLTETLAQGGGAAQEFAQTFEGAGLLQVSLRARPVVGSSDQRRLYLLAMEDITARKTLEAEQLRIIQELERANEELKNFAYVVSHDLKAPLRAIGSLADWIAQDQRDRLDAEGQEHLRLLQQRVRRMDGLIDGILQYSRIGRQQEQVLKVDLNLLLKEVVDSLAPPPHIEVTVAPLPVVRADRTQMQQVFQNLLANAIRFLDKPEGRIRVEAAELAEHWRFSVSDNGPGIEARHFDRIFQLFQTLNPRDRVESTGVGLSIVKKIVENLGGQVAVESTPGQGSQFHVLLPKFRLQSSSPKASSHESRE